MIETSFLMAATVCSRASSRTSANPFGRPPGLPLWPGLNLLIPSSAPLFSGGFGRHIMLQRIRHRFRPSSTRVNIVQNCGRELVTSPRDAVRAKPASARRDTGAVAARVEDVQQGATVIAAPLPSAERFGPAGR